MRKRSYRMTEKQSRVVLMLFEALQEAHDHLEYCGYGDSWERECARDSGLPEKIEEALTAASIFGIDKRSL